MNRLHHPEAKAQDIAVLQLIRSRNGVRQKRGRRRMNP